MVSRSILFSFFAITFAINSVEAAPFQPNDKSPDGIVLRVYKDFAWEAVMARSFDGLMQQPKGVLKQYFDEKLTSLILKDQACAEKKGMCNLSFVPIWGSQDPSAGDLTVEKTDDPNIITVKFRYCCNDEKIELKYRVTKTGKGWRISDISGKNWSLLSILSSPEPE
jgi:hypothetical protein